MRFCAFLLTALALSAWPSQADAQIYAWRDANGTLVLSDRAIDAPTDVYTVPGAPKYVTTRPAEDLVENDRYEPLIQEHSNRQALRPELVRAVIQVESGFNPRALSPKGAMGLMQLMPATARSLGVNNPWEPTICGCYSTNTTATRNSRSPRTTPGREPSPSTAAAYRRIARRVTTSARLARLPESNQARGESSSSTRPSRFSTVARFPDTPRNAPRPERSRSSAAESGPGSEGSEEPRPDRIPSPESRAPSPESRVVPSPAIVPSC